jgi:thiol-disulfide isomerase/thioredoxin
MGTISTLSRAKTADAPFCEHKVPEENCTRHHPELAERFKSVGDWCPEHDLPESQCLLCHPELTFDPLPKASADADIETISAAGEDVPSLDAHAVAGKVTVFDFYADWCAPCVEIDVHMIALLNTRSDIAYRKLNVVGWDTPLAKRYMGKVPALPYVVVYGKDGKVVAPVVGFNLRALDAAIAKGAAR